MMEYLTFELQGFTKKLQSELVAQYSRKIGGSTSNTAEAASFYPSSSTSISNNPSNSVPAARVAGASGGGLGSVSTSVPLGLGSGGQGGLGGMGGSGGPTTAGNLSALKMSVNTFTRELASSMSINRGNAGDNIGGSPVLGGGSGGNSRDGKATLFKPGGLNFNMQQTAARTREGFAKLANLGKLGGGGD